MEHDPQVPPYITSDSNSFASVSAQHRWPTIVTGAIDDVYRATANAKDESTKKEGKTIVEKLTKLKYEVQHDRELTPIDDDGQHDVEGYNEELKQRGNPTWQDVSWLYAECYLYRRIATFFALSQSWKSYDIFSASKISTFKSSRPAVLELASRYREITTQLSSKTLSTDVEALLFTEICEISLWGNATDLSLLTNLTYDDLQKLQGSAARKAAESNILTNDLPAALASLRATRQQNPKGDRRIDIVLDNAGFELYVDLLLAAFLLAADLATHVVLHPKSIPWFVSDVTPRDFSALLSALADPQSFYSASDSDSRKDPPLSEAEVSDLRALFSTLSSAHVEGALILRPNAFWTHAGSFWRMPALAPALFADLRTSSLVIFKGDLNSRKLTGDVMWPVTTAYREALGPLARDGIRVLGLRTCKADTVVGLEAGVDEKLREGQEGEGRRWAWGGKWAVVNFCDGF